MFSLVLFSRRINSTAAAETKAPNRSRTKNKIREMKVSLHHKHSLKQQFQKVLKTTETTNQNDPLTAQSQRDSDVFVSTTFHSRTGRRLVQVYLPTCEWETVHWDSHENLADPVDKMCTNLQRLSGAAPSTEAFDQNRRTTSRDDESYTALPNGIRVACQIPPAK